VKSVETDHECKVTVLRNQKVQTDGTVPDNKAGHHDPWTCVLIDAAISGDRNVTEKEDEKILRHKNFKL
jgi:hypothetical protein